MRVLQSRRDFVASAAAASLLGSAPSLADEGPPETTTIRLPFNSNICLAPQYVAEELLRAEGFTDIHYVPAPLGVSAVEMVARGDIDWNSTFAGTLVYQLDKG